MKIAIVDPRVEEQISDCLETCSCGILLGQKAETDKYLIAHVAPLKETYSDANDSYSKLLVLDDKLNIDNAVDYVIQVIKSLLGGIQVIGILFYGDPNEVFGKYQFVIKEVARKIKEYYLQSECLPETGTDLLLSCLCENSSNIVCKSYDINDAKDTMYSVDWKMGTSKLNWCKVHTTYSIDFQGPIPKGKKDKSFLLQVKSCLEPVFKTLASGYYIMNNVIRVPSDKLLSKSEDDHLFSIDIFPDAFVSGKDEIVVSDKEISMLKIQGTIYSVAFVHPKSTVEFASTCIKNDIYRTLLNRFELHCDSIVQEENEESILFHEPPRRILFPLSEDILVGDYLFPGEDESFCMDNISQYFNIDINSNDVINHKEMFIDRDEQVSEYNEESPTKQEITKGGHSNYEIIAGLTIAFSAIFLYYFYNVG